MASYVRCLCVLSLVFLSFSFQIQARDSKFFNKFTTKKSNDNKETIINSSTSASPAPAPSPESDLEVKEHGYGLYGSESYGYTPTTTEPVKSTRLVGEETYVPVEDLNNKKKKQDFEEFESGYYGNNYPENKGNNENGYVSERQGMSDTRFMENGKYYYDVSNDKKAYNGNDKEMSEYVNEEKSYPENHGSGNGNGNEYVSEKQGMSDTRFLENGKYYYDANKEKMNENSYYHPNKWNGNGNGNEKQGLSDTRFLENGKYYHDINNEVGEFGNNYNNDNNNQEYVSNNGNNEYENGYNNGENEFGTEEKEEYNYMPHEYKTQERVKSKKLPPNQYDSMEEYEKEQEYKQSQNEYVP